MYKVLICGARDWSDKSAIDRLIDNLIESHGRDKLIIIEGGAEGADMLARISATERSVHVAEVRALWQTRHRGAGPQRNSAMLGLDPDEVHAFHEDLSTSKGTKDMVRRARSQGGPSARACKVTVHSC